jgi:hypothetical protein
VNQENKVPEWMLERYLLNELPRKKRRQLEKELEQNPALRSELEKLRVSDRQILSTYPADQVIPQLLKRAALVKPETTAPRRSRLVWIAAPALALAVFMLIILPPLLQRRLDFSGNSQPEDYIGMKGSGPLSAKGPGLQIYRKGSGADKILRNGESARAGELLQLAYIPAGQTHGIILSIDGAGSVTLHFPEKTDGNTGLQSNRRVLLANAFELDRAPNFERFFFITAKEPLPTAAILAKAGELAADPDKAMTERLDLPGRYGQFSLLVRK